GIDPGSWDPGELPLPGPPVCAMAIPTTKMPAHARTKAVVRVMEVPLLGSMNSSPSSSRRIEDGLGAILALVAEHPARFACPRGHFLPSRLKRRRLARPMPWNLHR